VDDNHVEVRRVGVGVLDVNVDDLVAGGQCDGTGRARGVRNITTENKGS